MESRLFLSKPQLVKSLYIDTIMFDDSDTLSLWASGQSLGKTVIVPLVINFNMLNKILRAAGNHGKKAALAVSTALAESHKSPVMLDLPALIGTGITLNRFDVVVCEVLEEGKATKNRLFIIEGLYRSRKPTPRNTPQYAATFWQELAAEAQAFYNYHNALINGFNVKNAKTIAGLECPVSFQKAEAAAKKWEGR